jgi:hypothetical protein
MQQKAPVILFIYELGLTLSFAPLEIHHRLRALILF